MKNLSEGADVAFVHLPEEARDAEETKSIIEKQGRRALPLALDLSKEASASEAVEKTVAVEKRVAAFGKLDIVVNNAAFQRSHEKLSEIGYEEFAHLFKVNVSGTFAVPKAAEKG